MKVRLAARAIAAPVLAAVVAFGAGGTAARADVPDLEVSTLAYLGGQSVAGPAVAGEEYLLQSQAIDRIGQRDGWRCAVTFGDGATGGSWRAKPQFVSAPCAAFHTYTAAGTYTATMTVTDPSGASRTWRDDITVVGRPITARRAGVQGSPISLDAGPGATGPVVWQVTPPRAGQVTTGCGPLGTTATLDLTCWVPGTYRVTATAPGLTPVGYDVTWDDAAPTITSARVVRPDRSGQERETTRAGTGDQLTVRVDLADPSFHTDQYGTTTGDALSCRLDLGDGRVLSSGDPSPSRTCTFLASYLAPGTYTPTLSANDGYLTTTRRLAPITIVRRDVAVLASGTTQGGYAFEARVALVAGQLRGSATFRSGSTTAGFTPSTLALTPTGVAVSGPQRDGAGAIGRWWIDPGLGQGNSMMFALDGADGSGLLTDFASTSSATYRIDAAFVPLSRRAGR